MSDQKYFNIHFDDHHNDHQKKAAGKTHKVESMKEHHVGDEKRTFKEVLQDAFRQIVASALILAVGFLLLNWSAYTQIAKQKWNQFFDIETGQQLNDIVQGNTTVYTKKILETSNDPLVQKRQIPDLNLEVAPSDNRIIIPRINQNIPMIRTSTESLINRDWAALERQMQEALRHGVVHYPGTSLPGQNGNIVITGHSSYFPWDPGRFKDVFALLHDVVVGDKIVVYYNQDKYTYEVNDIKIVLPEDIEVLKQTPKDKLTLITCTPVGTNLKRLIVSATPIAINDVAIPDEVVQSMTDIKVSR